MQVREIMRSKARVCGLETTLEQAGNTMAEAGCGFLPVLTDSGQVVGAITDRDVCLALTRRDSRPSEVQVQEVISGECYTCRVDDEIAEALETMRAFAVRRLPVVDDEQRLKGILSLDDVILESRALGPESYRGPIYSDVARTLKGICGRSQIGGPSPP
jgi:CBS domain-containing protein